MKKRVLASLLCMMLSVSMVAEASAEMFTDEITEITDFSEEASVSEETVPEQQPVTADTGDIFISDFTDSAAVIPDSSDETATAVKDEEDTINNEESIIGAEEDAVSNEENTIGTEDGGDNGIEDVISDDENNNVDAFSSGATEVMPIVISDDEEATENQTKSVYYAADWVQDNGKWKLHKAVEQGAADAGVSTAALDEENAVEVSVEMFDGLEAVSEEAVPAEMALEETTTEEEPSAPEKEYFDLEDGIVHIVTVKSKTNATKLADGYYLFDKDGYLVTGRYKMKAGTAGYTYDKTNEYFYMDDANASYLSGTTKGVKTPYNSNLGQLQKKYWLWTGTSFRYYDETGKFTSVSELKEKELKNNTYVGYYKINGQYYALKSSGTPRKGTYMITEGKKPGEYYFSTKIYDGIPGRMLRNGWVYSESKSRWRYFGKEGIRTSYTSMVTTLNTKVMGNYQYLLDKDGYLVKNKPCKVNGIYYYGNSKGRIVKNSIITYNGKRYYFTANGKRATYRNGWYRAGSTNRYYYFDGSSAGGRIKEKTGWQKIKNQWYYFLKNGNHYVNYWSSKGRYFYPDGHMATGLCTIDGAKYFFRTAGSSSVGSGGKVYKNTIVKSGSTWYYATSTGKLQKSGWIKYGGNDYYLKSYKIQKNTFAKLNGVNVYLNSEGKYQTGWVIINDKKNLVKYVNPTGNDFYKNTTAWINGLQYRFDSDGYRVNDRTSEISGPYYVEVDIVNCVMTIYNSARNIPVKSIRISPGAAATPTPTGTYYLNRLGRWWTLMGPSYGQYCTHVVGAGQGGIIIHSVPTIYQSVYSFSPGSYNLLGQPASHGCIRCCVADSKWVYDHCQGSTIYIFRGSYKSNEVFKGPLGRRPIVPATGNFDPTDPAVVG